MIIREGTRVIVFDHSIFKDDKSTPLAMTMKPAVVTKQYDYVGSFGIYRDVIDVIFDHRPDKISKAHFSEHIGRIL